MESCKGMGTDCKRRTRCEFREEENHSCIQRACTIPSRFEHVEKVVQRMGKQNRNKTSIPNTIAISGLSCKERRTKVEKETNEIEQLIIFIWSVAGRVARYTHSGGSNSMLDHGAFSIVLRSPITRSQLVFAFTKSRPFIGTIEQYFLVRKNDTNLI